MESTSIENENWIKELWAWVGSIDWKSREFYGLQSEIAKSNECSKNAVRQALKRQKNLTIAVEVRKRWQERQDAAKEVMV